MAKGEYTQEEVREMFLIHVNKLVSYWNREKQDKKEALQGLAFSIMTMLDGCAMDLPAFIVAPMPHESDKQYNQDNGDRWFPENHESKVNCDIAGSLHELLHKYE